MKKKKEFELCIQQCMSDPQVKAGLTLTSYLITPVQRIPRYILLLKVGGAGRGLLTAAQGGWGRVGPTYCCSRWVGQGGAYLLLLKLGGAGLLSFAIMCYIHTYLSDVLFV